MNAKLFCPLGRYTPITNLVSLQGRNSSPNYSHLVSQGWWSWICAKYVLASKTLAGCVEHLLLPIQDAMSSMLGTVAETRAKRTEEPRVFIREMTTSRVLPRDSLRI